VRLDSTFCLSHAWALEGDYVCIRVSDTGIGIPAEVREHIFEPFFTTKEVGKGTGLGLASAYGIVKRHKGLIHLESKPKDGTTFQVYLPTAADSFKEVQSEKAKEPTPSGQGETILFAEDEKDVRQLVERILIEAGYRVLIARDGEEALEAFQTQSSQIDLALLDVVMPKKGGVAVFEEIRARRPDCPVLFSSGYGFSYLSGELQEQSGVEIIRKPYGRNDLLSRIRQLLDTLR